MGKSKKKLKICFVLEHFYPHVGGAENLFWRLASNISDECEVRIITSDSGGINGKKKYEDFEVYYYNWKGLFGHPIPSRKDIRAHIKWADLVHTVVYTAAPTTVRVAKQEKKPCVITVHEYLHEKWFWIDNPLRAVLFFIFEWWVVHKPYDAYISVSQATTKDLIKRGGIKAEKISHIWPILEEMSERELPSNKNNKYYIFYGRPGKTKGVHILLEAINHLVKNGYRENKFVLVLASDPADERARILKKIKNYKLGEYITVLPSQERNKLDDLIRKAYAVIVPSVTEGFGYSAVEACGLGKPIIASDAGSLPEVVSGQVLTFKNRDSLDLANKIKLADKNKFMKVEKKIFDTKEAKRKTLALYKTLINKGK